MHVTPIVNQKVRLKNYHTLDLRIKITPGFKKKNHIWDLRGKKSHAEFKKIIIRDLRKKVILNTKELRLTVQMALLQLHLVSCTKTHWKNEKSHLNYHKYA